MSKQQVLPEHGGHRWISGEGQEVCEFGCGAFSDRDSESWIPPTDPHGMCPRNPRAKGKFTFTWRYEKPYAYRDGGHSWHQALMAEECIYCHEQVPYRIGTQTPIRALPDGPCDLSPVMATRRQLGELFARPSRRTAPVVP